MSAMPLPAPLESRSTGGRLVTPDGRSLPFRGGELSVDAAGGLARVVLRQRFENPYAEPLRVTYQVPLPGDAAVSGYAFELGEERIVGVVDTKASARERFEEALLDGRTAALLEQDRSSLFTQEVGNLPPGAVVVCELVLDQLLAWEGAGWTWRFPTVVAPRFLGEQGRVRDAGRVTVDVAEGGTDARLSLALRVRDALTGPIASPTHALHVVGAEVGLATERGAALDRDLVVRWSVAAPRPGIGLDLARAAADRSVATAAAALLTLVPPAQATPTVPRDLVVLLDTSGSMSGAPMDQAKAVTCALIDSLGPQDQLQLVEFSTRPRAWQEQAVAATAQHRAAATAWVRALRAGGATQMKDGILAALARLRDEAQRQVVLVTDGLIGFEHEIVAAVARRLPRGCRVHTLGIGSSVNRSLLTPVARAGGGVEAIVGLDEDPAKAAAALVAATAGPQVVDLELSGSALVEVAHHRPPDLLAGRPVRLGLRLRAEGGTLRVRGHGAAGPWEEVLVVPPVAFGSGSPAVLALVGRELVEEQELRAALGEAVDDRVEALGLAWQIATRRTSWVAVSEQRTVDPTAPTRRERVPQALPYGMSVEGLGLRHAVMAEPMACMSEAVLDKERSWVARSEAPRGGRARKQAELRYPSAPPPPAARPAAPSGPPADGPMAPPRWSERHYSGRLVLARGDRLVLELAVPGPISLSWRAPGRVVTLRLRDGREVQVELDRAASTRDGALRSGEVLRIVLRGPDMATLATDVVEAVIDADTVGQVRLHLRLVAP